MADPEDGSGPRPGGSGARESTEQGASDGNRRGPSQGTVLRALLDDHFTLVRSTDGRMFGVPLTEPGRALQHDAASSPLVREVARLYLDREGRWPAPNGVAECSSYALAMFDLAPVVPVPLRSHWDRASGALFLDTCDARDVVIRVDASGVTEVAPPVPFRRAPIPAPLVWTTDTGSAADVARLWELVPVVPEDRPIVLALLIVAWLTGVPQPVVLLVGPEDSGKTSTARFLLSFVDPTTTVRGRALPTDERGWKAAVAISRCVLVDNLSGLNAESSDLLCRVATGGEAASRALYTDDASHVSNLHVPVWLTAIDPGALRGDLASRIVRVELEPLEEKTRVAESELGKLQDEIRPTVARGLLWLTGRVLAEWPTLDKTGLRHRMGDFAIIVRAVDKILGTDGEKRLADDAVDLAADVVNGDPVALALVDAFATGKLEREVTPAGLLAILDATREPFPSSEASKGWPRTPTVLGAKLRRLEPALKKSHGIIIERHKSGSSRYLKIARVIQP